MDMDRRKGRNAINSVTDACQKDQSVNPLGSRTGEEGLWKAIPFHTSAVDIKLLKTPTVLGKKENGDRIQIS